METNRIDVMWNYIATFLKITASALLLPLMLRMMSTETVGIWIIFITIISFVGLLDFGFNPSFARNVTYIFSGVRELKAKGVVSVGKENNAIDYGLLKGVIIAMRWFYLRVSVALFVLLITLGTYYIHTLMQNYKGERSEVYLAWMLLCVINTYNLFTFYYESLLLGKGLIKRSKQIIIVGQIAYLIIASVLIMAGHGLVAIVSSQASSVLIMRLLSYRAFFTKELKRSLFKAMPRPPKEIFQAIYPNAVKVGLTTIGGFMTQKSAIVIASFYLALEKIASYGVSMQFIGVIVALSGVYTATYRPKIAHLRVEHNNLAIKELYLKGQIILFATYILGGVSLLFFGRGALHLIGSRTQLMPFLILLLALFLSLVETNLSIAGDILLTKNEVPFFKASLLSGSGIILGLIIVFNFTDLGLYCMVLVPLIVDLAYSGWKWPLEVIKELNISNKDIFFTFKTIKKSWLI